jgi:hypothetical protein
MADQLHSAAPPRRAVPRQPADWFGFYRFDDAESDTWRCGRVVDISPLGAGLELFGTDIAEDQMEGPVTISLELRGTPRNIVSDAKLHSARVGVEFVELSLAAKRYLRTMNGLKSRW